MALVAGDEMKKSITTALILVALTITTSHAQTGTDLVSRYFKIDKSKRVDEFVVRDAILKIVPLGTDLKEAIKRLERNGIKYWDTCAPADRSPIWCNFSSPKNQPSEASYVIEFFFDQQNKFKNVEVVRSYRNKVQEYTTYPTKPAKNLILKNNLAVGSPVKAFDKTYGEGQLNQSTDFANDWPLTLEYHDKERNLYFYTGVEIGEMTAKEMKAVKQNRRLLGEMKVGIIFTEWPDPLLGK
jgi:hypothetical protein